MAVLGALPAREQRLIMMRFWGNMTQQQIADRLNISQMHVSRLLRQALSTLRVQLTDSQPAPAPALEGSAP